MNSPRDSQLAEPSDWSNSQAEQRTVLATTQARQGVTGHNVRYVLGFGLAAVIIAFALIYFVYVV